MRTSGNEEILQETPTSFWRKRRWLLWTAGGVFAGLLILTVVLTLLAHRVEPFLRAQIIAGLEQRFHTHVELDHFHVAVHHGEGSQWGVWARGDGLRIWPPATPGGDRESQLAPQSTPLIRLGEFSFHVPLRYETAKSVHIAEVRLKGLEIHVPPRSKRKGQIEAMMSAPAASVAAIGPMGAQPRRETAEVLSNFVVDRIDCDDATLLLETDKPNKLPMGFLISHLRLSHVTSSSPVAFEAEMTNPKPRGIIRSTGNFGPWNTEDPGESPVKGTYHFEHADLATFRGIAGTLSSTGSYEGTLRNETVVGDADVPNFSLSHFGYSMPLHTHFHAHVDGTDGDTQLDQVNATLGHSSFTTQGQIFRVRGPSGSAAPSPASEIDEAALGAGGHVIDLKVDVPHGHIDDFLHLAGRNAAPLLTGDVAVEAKLHIPPGKEPVYERLKLDGSFKLDQAHFTSENIQQKIESLSLRGQGRPGELKSSDPNDVSSEMQGSFHMSQGVIALPDLQYTVPGAKIQLRGTYGLEGRLNFEGTARMQATISQMVGGWKGLLLKPADRFFKRDGAGAEIPIQIRGTRDQPEFGLDLHRMKKTSPETPGAEDK